MKKGTKIKVKTAIYSMPIRAQHNASRGGAAGASSPLMQDSTRPRLHL